MSKEIRLWIMVIIVAGILISAIAFFFKEEAKTVTAKEYYDYANSLATEWSLDSKLRALSSHEGVGGHNGKCAIDSSTDTVIGDGRTVFWCYVFSSESKNKSYVILIDSDMKLLETYEYEGSVAWYSSRIGANHDMTISNWIIDSDVALAKALESDDDFFELLNTSKNNVAINIILRDLEVNNTHTEFWIIWYYSGNISEMKEVLVDASNGIVLYRADLEWI